MVFQGLVYGARRAAGSAAKEAAARGYATAHTTLGRGENQALALGEYAVEFVRSGAPSAAVLKRTNLFYTDANLCGASALALGCNAPTVLREEALRYQLADGVPLFGTDVKVHPEKACLAHAAAVREWDSNGTNFGYNPALGHTAGEFGHNDFYSVPIAAAQQTGADGAAALKGMVLLDEIRGRLAEVFSAKSYKIDHVLHGAIGSAATYGAMMGATPAQIESAIGMVVAHYVPFRAIRAGKQLSDSKGSSAAISTEVAVMAMKRSMGGFVGPKDIFRNPEAVFRLFEGPGQMLQGNTGIFGSPKRELDLRPDYASPFDLVLGTSGDDFTIMGMHFKLGLYEHQSAGAIQAIMNLLNAAPDLVAKGDGSNIKRIKIVAYEPAFGIIGDPAKKDPKTRQSADHSMAFIISTLIRKALEQGSMPSGDAAWKAMMLSPYDYSKDAIYHPVTRALMDKIDFAHGGEEYDKLYPDGIPTSVVIEGADGKHHDSKLVMYPAGHARNTTADLEGILAHKFKLLGDLCTSDSDALVKRFSNLEAKSAAEIAAIHSFEISPRSDFVDA